MVLAIIIIFAYDYPYFQVIWFVIVTLSEVLWFAIVWPFEERILNIMQLYNSSTKFVAACLLFAWAGTNIIIEHAVIVGWFWVVVLFLNIAVNSVVIAIDPVKRIK